jgi:hypothetical protein
MQGDVTFPEQEIAFGLHADTDNTFKKKQSNPSCYIIVSFWDAHH